MICYSVGYINNHAYEYEGEVLVTYITGEVDNQLSLSPFPAYIRRDDAAPWEETLWAGPNTGNIL
jgi:hypothetical protein